jgi:hypothetical protein
MLIKTYGGYFEVNPNNVLRATFAESQFVINQYIGETDLISDITLAYSKKGILDNYVFANDVISKDGDIVTTTRTWVKDAKFIRDIPQSRETQ